MRPLRLTMTAFGPYAGTETVDFDGLTELGLFVVAGRNGSGKTTIFDALHYGLYGKLPGRRHDYHRLKSDHAAESSECKVVLDFAAKGAHWRVERTPKQRRAKRRGTGTTEVDSRAALFQIQPDGSTKAVASKLGEVTTLCRELVGLTGRQFERVALLPQGEFSRVLQEGPTKRRELLRTLFSSEIFGDATSQLVEEATVAGASDRTALDNLQHQQGVLAGELSELVGRAVDTTETGLRQAAATYRQGTLAELATSVAELDRRSQQARKEQQVAHELVERVERRNRVRIAVEAHRQAATTNERDQVRLRHARAAIPVVAQTRTLAQQQAKGDAASKRVDELHAQIDHALALADVEPLTSVSPETILATTTLLQTLTQLLDRRHDAAARRDDMRAASNQLIAEQRRADHTLSQLTEQAEIQQAQVRQTTARLAELEVDASIPQSEQQLREATAQLAQRSELATLDSDDHELAAELATLDSQIDTMVQNHERAAQAQTSLAALERKAEQAINSHQACVQRLDHAKQFASDFQLLTTARRKLDAAQAEASSQWDAFIAGTAARVAQALVDDEPCPVCGSCNHPEVVTEADVALARTAVDAAQAEVQDLQIRIEALRAAQVDIAQLVVAELAAEATTTKAMALGARAAADTARQTAATGQDLAAALQERQEYRATLAQTRNDLDGRRNHLRGALGTQADQSVAELQAVVTNAQHQHDRAIAAVELRAEVQAQLQQAQAQVENLGLKQITANNKKSSLVDQLQARRIEHGKIDQTVTSLDAELVLLTASSTITEPLLERQAQAARRALDMLGQAGPQAALRDDAETAIRRAQALLAERVTQSEFASADDAVAAFVDPDTIEQLEAQIADHAATQERLQGQLDELGDLPSIAPDTESVDNNAAACGREHAEANRTLIAATTSLDRIDAELDRIVTARAERQNADQTTRRLERVAALVKGDNDRNTSLENWVLGAHLRDVVELANLRLAQSTHQRFQLCVLDDGENRRGTWGLDLGIEDTVTGTRRPTAGLSGGELFQASLALALGLADAVMNQTAGVQIDSLFIDEGFGSLDEHSVERAIDLLDDLRDRGALVGVITHVPALLESLPIGVEVVDAGDGQGSTIKQVRSAA